MHCTTTTRTNGCALAVAVFFIATGARAEQLERAPYLQMVTSSRATVVWTTDESASSEVRYGSAPNALDQEVTNTDTVTQHEVTLSGLSAGTRYYYSVGSVGNDLAGGDADHYFETAPAAGSPAKMRLWVVGDSGTGGSKQGLVRDSMLEFAGDYRPDLFLHLGDMAYSTGTTNEFSDKFFAMYAGILNNTPVWPTMGNHEGASSNSDQQSGPYYTAYVLPTGAEAGGVASGTEAYYSFDYGNAHFVVLDSHQSDRDPSGAMLTWMSADLSATDQDWIIAYWHHPPYTKGSHNSDSEGRLIDMRENALPLLEAAGVDLVLAGHSHIYERSYLVDGGYDTPTVDTASILDNGSGDVLGDGPYTKSFTAHDGAVYIVAGHGGTGVTQQSTHPLMYVAEAENGSVVLDLQGNSLSITNVRWDGEVTDRAALIKSPGIVVGAPDGNETFRPNESVVIRWGSAGAIDEVEIAWSDDDGATWAVIDNAASNSGSYNWTTPNVDTSQALVRVASTSDSQLFDESNAGFTILGDEPPSTGSASSSSSSSSSSSTGSAGGASAAAGVGGAGGSANAPPAAVPGTSDGCSCATPGHTGGRTPPWWALVALLTIGVRALPERG